MLNETFSEIFKHHGMIFSLLYTKGRIVVGGVRKSFKSREKLKGDDDHQIRSMHIFSCCEGGGVSRSGNTSSFCQDEIHLFRPSN